MKFFLELKSCLGRAAVVEASGGGQQSAAQDLTGHEATDNQRLLTKAKSSGSVTQWKPKLQAISEDFPISQVVGTGVDLQSVETDVRKRPPPKVKPKSTAKASPSSCHVQEYWKTSQATALPVFSPTPFLF